MNKTISLALVLVLAMALGAANADYIFGTVTYFPNSSPFTSPSISTDGLYLYVDSQQIGGQGGYDVFVYMRSNINDDWLGPANVGPPINNSYGQGNPDIWPDGLTLIFDDDRPGSAGGYSDMWMATRATPTGDWSEPIPLAINSPYDDSHSTVTGDGLWLFFCSDRPGTLGGRDIWYCKRTTINDPWSEPINLGPTVNSQWRDSGVDVSSDGRMLFFDSERPGSLSRDIWLSTRATANDPWSEPVNLGPAVNSPYHDITPCISADGSTLYFYSHGSLKQVAIMPKVDFNGDGQVNNLDIDMLMLNWGTNNSLYDIGPTPLGDGIVDAEDLIVLALYITDGGATLAGDVNCDGVVDLLDLAELSRNWLQQQP